MCDKAVDSYLLILKLFSDWILTSKMIEKFDSGVLSNNDIVIDEIDSDFVTFFSNDIGLNSITLDNLDDDVSDDCDPETISFDRVMDWHNRVIQCQASKKR